MIAVKKFQKKYISEPAITDMIEEFCKSNKIYSNQIIKLQFVDICGKETAYLVWDDEK